MANKDKLRDALAAFLTATATLVKVISKEDSNPETKVKSCEHEEKPLKDGIFSFCEPKYTKPKGNKRWTAAELQRLDELVAQGMSTRKIHETAFGNRTFEAVVSMRSSIKRGRVSL